MPRSDQSPAAIDTEILDTVVRLKQGQLFPSIRRWHDPPTLRAHLRDELTEQVRRRVDLGLAQEFADHCPVPGAVAEDYTNRWVALPVLGQTLVGPRFRGGDLARPFVDIVVSSEPPRTTDHYVAVLDPLRAMFARFAPRRVRCFVPAHVPVDLAAFGGGAEWDQRFLAAPLDDLLRRPAPANLDRVALAAPPDLAFYPWYVGLYDDIFGRCPEHREYARVETREDLASYAAAGGLFLASVDNRRAGVVAAVRGVEQGMGGFVVAELVLDREHRGHGLGAALQRRLVEALPRKPGDALIGTIDARNAPARAAAKRSGREDVGGYLWVDVP